MTQWVAFAVVTNAVLIVVLALARATQAMTVDESQADGVEDSQSDGSIEESPVDESIPASTADPRAGRPDADDSRDDGAETDDAGDADARDDERDDPNETATNQNAIGPFPADGGTPSRRSGDAATEREHVGTDADREDTGTDADPEDTGADADRESRPTGAADAGPPMRDELDLDEFSTGALLVNVAATHGTLGAVLLIAAWTADVPAAALGVEATAASTGAQAILVGVALGGVLYAANELVAANLDRVGVEYSEDLRDALGPDSLVGWLVLLGVVLPTIAAFEELLFRAALIGALSAGFGLSPWLLAVLSSVAFGVGHGIQGVGGMVVTGLLGFVLAAGYVLTGSLLAVVIAHYLINALEFLVHEGAGIDWAGAR